MRKPIFFSISSSLQVLSNQTLSTHSQSEQNDDLKCSKNSAQLNQSLCSNILATVNGYGIRGSTHKWINSWLSERSQKLVLDSRASDPVLVLSGVPQRSVLGPVLFLIFINDLPDNIKSSVRLFADDCVLYRNINSPLYCQILQDDLNSLAKWEMDWQMKFNVSKYNSMRVTRLHPSRHIH